MKKLIYKIEYENLKVGDLLINKENEVCKIISIAKGDVYFKGTFGKLAQKDKQAVLSNYKIIKATFEQTREALAKTLGKNNLKQTEQLLNILNFLKNDTSKREKN